ncbi:MAG TPA: protoporphyrinogen oxidase [Acidobacteriota bacterium]|jgi:oxygen-dependent protoporphyrinogen oxidase
MIRRCGVAIVGGGISGLATAYYLRRLKPQISIAVLEASRYWGGKIITERRDGCVIEWGPDAFITSKPGALELVEELNLSGQVLSSQKEHSRTLVLRDGKLAPVPDHFHLLAPLSVGSFLKSSLFSFSGKVEVLRERFRPARKDSEDESIASFVRRRFGSEALDLLGGPLLAGIYMGDPERLSIQATFPQLVELERSYGSVTKGINRRKLPSAGGRSLFVTLSDGMETLTQTLLRKVDAALCSETAVHRIERMESGYRLHTGRDEIHADQVVVTVDPDSLRKMLSPPTLLPELSRLEATSSIVAIMVYDSPVSIPKAYGVLIPKSERRSIRAITFSSQKFAGRVPPGFSMLRVFAGGDSIVEMEDKPFLRLVSQELENILGIRAQPRFSRIIRWGKANPQYLVGHNKLIASLERGLKTSAPGVHLAGAAYYGVGIPDCIGRAKAVAAAMASKVE